MAITSRLGRRLSYRGAVVFEPPTGAESGVTISSIVLPCPSSEELFARLKQICDKPHPCRLTFRGRTRQDVMAWLEAFCSAGVPLPDLRDAATPHELSGITPFQRQVFSLTNTIPHGETRPYTWVATKMKRSRCERAVGRALGLNPFPLFVPCHRVVKKDGTLGGFMGFDEAEAWQVHLKRTLLELEEQHRQPSLFVAPRMMAAPAMV